MIGSGSIFTLCKFGFGDKLYVHYFFRNPDPDQKQHQDQNTDSANILIGSGFIFSFVSSGLLKSNIFILFRGNQIWIRNLIRIKIQIQLIFWWDSVFCSIFRFADLFRNPHPDLKHYPDPNTDSANIQIRIQLGHSYKSLIGF